MLEEGGVGEGVETRGEKEGEERGDPLELGLSWEFDSRELPDSSERLGKEFESLA